MRTKQLAFLAAFLIGGAVSFAEEAQIKRAPIHVDELNRTDVIGKLGIPLGQAAEIVATIIDGNSLNMKRYSGKYLLKVESVNGTPLEVQPTMEFQVPLWLHATLASNQFDLYELKHGKKAASITGAEAAAMNTGYVGSKFKLVVYEGGMFRGIPKNPPKDSVIRADYGFHFYTFLSVEVQRDPPPQRQ